MLTITTDNLQTYKVDLKNRTVETPYGDVLHFHQVIGLYVGSPSVEFTKPTGQVFFNTESVKSIDGDLLEVNPDLIEPGHVIFRTNNSLYEIDQEQKLVRRLAGVNPLESKHLPADLEWLPYQRVLIEQLQPAIIVYADGKYRRTSRVRDIFGTLISDPK